MVKVIGISDFGETSSPGLNAIVESAVVAALSRIGLPVLCAISALSYIPARDIHCYDADTAAGQFSSCELHRDIPVADCRPRLPWPRKSMTDPERRHCPGAIGCCVLEWGLDCGGGVGCSSRNSGSASGGGGGGGTSGSSGGGVGSGGAGSVSKIALTASGILRNVRGGGSSG